MGASCRGHVVHPKGLACLQRSPACLYLVLGALEAAWNQPLSVHVPLISTDARAASRHDALVSMSLIALIVRFLAPGYGIWESSSWSRPSGRCPVCRRAINGSAASHSTDRRTSPTCTEADGGALLIGAEVQYGSPDS
jgi:hypothetical protein